MISMKVISPCTFVSDHTSYSPFHVCMCLAQNPKPKPSAPSAWNRTAKPNSTHGKDSEHVCKQSNQQKKVTKISLLWEWGQDWPVRTSTNHTLLAQVGPYLTMQYTGRRITKALEYNVHVSIHFFLFPQVENQPYYRGQICIYSHARCSYEQFCFSKKKYYSQRQRRKNWDLLKNSPKKNADFFSWFFLHVLPLSFLQVDSVSPCSEGVLPSKSAF